MTDGVTMQNDLLACKIVTEERITDSGPGHWFYLQLGERVIPLGRDPEFARSFMWALRRNAESFEHEERKSCAEDVTRKMP